MSNEGATMTRMSKTVEDWFVEQGVSPDQLEELTIEGNNFLDTWTVSPIGRHARSFHWQTHPNDPPGVPGYIEFVGWVTWILAHPGCDGELQN